MGDKMKTTDQEYLKELAKNPKKSKRRHSYEVGDFCFQQFYSTSTDVFNPYCVYVYDKEGENVGAGSSPTIEESYHSLILSNIKFKTQYLNERNNLSKSLEKIRSITNENDEDSEYYF